MLEGSKLIRERRGSDFKYGGQGGSQVARGSPLDTYALVRGCGSSAPTQPVGILGGLPGEGPVN